MSGDVPVEVFVTKYAMSSGILKRRVHVRDSYARDANGYGFYGKRDFHHEWGAAVADAERRRGEKVASLKKQIAKIEKMDFTKDPTP